MLKRAMQRTPAITYRPDIDGLRAFAVLSVVFYHAFPNTLKGGFIGVDIFFVISGYLIGWIIMRDLEYEQFSFLNFYARRIRRIFPALIVVLTAALAFGWFALLPDEYMALGKHAFGGAAFIDNFLLWRESGYFDISSKLKPFLHLWSLGIEEQFYIFFPLILYLAYRNKFNFYFIISILLIFSFIYNIYISRIDRIADFYSPFTRFWELLVGALITVFNRQRFVKMLLKIKYKQIRAIVYRMYIKNDSQSLQYVFAIIGFSLLFISLLLCRPDNLWPEWKALLPVCGTSCIILAGPINILSKFLLCNRISVFLGKISYPLYLWHWVLFSFLFILVGPEAGLRYHKILAIIISISLSIITYFFIEKQIRFGHSYNKFKIFILCLCNILIIIAGYLICYNDGFLCRYNNFEELNYKFDFFNAKSGIFFEYQKNCLKVFPDLFNSKNNCTCKTQSDIDKVDVFLIGDSNVHHLYPGLTLLHSEHKFALFYSDMQPPFKDVLRISNGKEQNSKMITINNAYDIAMNCKNIKTVILSHNPDCSYDDSIILKDMHDQNLQNKDLILENAMIRSFDALKSAGKNVIFVLAPPSVPYEISKCINRQLYFLNVDPSCKFNKATYISEASKYRFQSILFRVVRKYHNVIIYDLSNELCDDNFCYVRKNNSILYFDRSHLSIGGSKLVARRLLNLIDN